MSNPQDTWELQHLTHRDLWSADTREKSSMTTVTLLYQQEVLEMRVLHWECQHIFFSSARTLYLCACWDRKCVIFPVLASLLLSHTQFLKTKYNYFSTFYTIFLPQAQSESALLFCVPPTLLAILHFLPKYSLSVLHCQSWEKKKEMPSSQHR